ncbi:MAG: hypothetical protein V4502_01740 [Pseudomonadota bacterium]
MRTETEVDEAIRHLEQAAGAARSFGRAHGHFMMLLDAFAWIKGKPSRFEADVMEKCRSVDRALRAEDN